MNTSRRGAPGATRTCPHCRGTILASATVCPACRHHLRFDPTRRTAMEEPTPAFTPLRVEGTIRHPAAGEAWEYTAVITVRNERGEEVARQVVGVGAMQPDETRSFDLVVEVYKPTTPA